MTRTERVTNRQAFEANMWEQSFKVFVEGEEVHGTKEYNRAIDIMLAIDKDFTLSLLETSATTEQTNTVTMYHGTHDNSLTFTNEGAIINYNHIGTWFTSNKSYAGSLYGKNVIEAQITVNNPLYLNDEDFDNLFYDTELANLYNVTIEGEKKKGKLINCIWTNGEYIEALKQSYIDQGYDSIIFENSNIDLSTNEEPHTVVILLNTDNILQSQYVN